MKKRLASLFVLLVLAAGAFAGIPLPFGESECSMGGMMDMDCCKAALRQKGTARITDAELYCALSCARNGFAAELCSCDAAVSGACAFASGDCTVVTAVIISIPPHRSFAWSTQFRADLSSQSRPSNLIPIRPYCVCSQLSSCRADSCIRVRRNEL